MSEMLKRMAIDQPSVGLTYDYFSFIPYMGSGGFNTLSKYGLLRSEKNKEIMRVVNSNIYDVSYIMGDNITAKSSKVGDGDIPDRMIYLVSGITLNHEKCDSVTMANRLSMMTFWDNIPTKNKSIIILADIVDFALNYIYTAFNHDGSLLEDTVEDLTHCREVYSTILYGELPNLFNTLYGDRLGVFYKDRSSLQDITDCHIQCASDLSGLHAAIPIPGIITLSAIYRKMVLTEENESGIEYAGGITIDTTLDHLLWNYFYYTRNIWANNEYSDYIVTYVKQFTEIYKPYIITMGTPGFDDNSFVDKQIYLHDMIYKTSSSLNKIRCL